MIGLVVSFASPAAARAAGVGRVPQDIEVLEQLSVAENVFAGHTGLGEGVLIYRHQLEERSRAILDDLGPGIDPKAIVASLTSGPAPPGDDRPCPGAEAAPALLV